MEGSVAVKAGAVAVDLNNTVACLEIIGRNRILIKNGDGGRTDDTGHGGDDDKNDEPQYDVHERPGSHDNKALPGGFVVQGIPFRGTKRRRLPCDGSAAGIIFALHSDIAADGKRPHRILCAALYGAPELGTHAKGKLLDFNPKELCKEKMAGFVQDNYDAEYQNGQNNCFQESLLEMIKKR